MSMKMTIPTVASIEKHTGLIYAGVTQVCGMPIDVFTSSGRLPLWSGAADPAPIQPRVDEPVKVIKHTIYVLTDKGKDALAKYDGSISDAKYVAIIKTLQAINTGSGRQSDVVNRLGLTQQRVWYLAKKLTAMGMIETKEI